MHFIDAFPRVVLGDLTGGPDTVVLAPTARLAAEVRRGHGRIQRARGQVTWRALNGATLAQWLDHLCSAALLRGEIPADAVPGTFLTRPQERCLWQKAVADDVAATHAAASELFDHEGLATLAMEADGLAKDWQVEVPAPWQSDEYRAFMRWRERIAQIIKQHDWIGARDAIHWRIDCIARGLSGLPKRVGLAGFVLPDPALERLLAILQQRGVELVVVALGAGDGDGAATSIHSCLDATHECLAAARWARDWLARSPTARLRIGVADWPARRHLLATALDATLHPEAIGAGWAPVERTWGAIGGESLADHYLVDRALRLLQLGVHPQGVPLQELGDLLCGQGWSADIGEADARAQIEVLLREVMPPEVSLDRVVRRLTSADDRRKSPWDFARLGAPRTHAALEQLARARGRGSRLLPGEWGGQFASLLDTIGWPGERELTGGEALVCQQLREALTGLATLDAVVGRVDGARALRLARQWLRDLTCTAPRSRAPSVEIGRLEDMLGAPVDGLWLMGMNEGAWPAPPRPNPLLPVPIQRRLGIPGAHPPVMLAAAVRLQRAWAGQAGALVYSWSAREGERELRMSPMLSGLPVIAVASPDMPAAVPAEMPADLSAAIERIDDAQAPPVDAAERARLRGGTSLLAAQAICPAWGFYQFRLGAAVLPAPTSGIDARVRGGLLHWALEAFWRDRALADVRAMSDAARADALAQAIASALAQQQARDPERISPRLRSLESQRLQRLLEAWLALEMERADFTVEACESAHALEIAGLPVRVVVDRVDRLADGRLVVIDYKSGRSASADSWAAARITEPQLPIYAAMVFPDSEVAAVALARVVTDGSAFLGVAAGDDLVPGIKTLEGLRKRYTAEDFPDWASLRVRWAERIEALAREIIAGDAAVRITDEADLAYCPVSPLLRLAERRQQWLEQS